MADLLETQGVAECPRIDPWQEIECRYWCRQFGVRPKDLKRAVRAVGNRADDVEEYLGPGKTGPNDASHWRAMSGL